MHWREIKHGPGGETKAGHREREGGGMAGTTMLSEDLEDCGGFTSAPMELAYHHANLDLAVAIAMASSVEFPGVAAGGDGAMEIGERKKRNIVEPVRWHPA
jgi:hypothetical protein